MAIINIGILAHVDAGKTSLTERILFHAGVIETIGSVDKGTTQTDTLELERARGITIKAAVVSFNLNQLNVNLIDTPGHADFIAEVERSLRVLDAVVLVVSAVEGVQAQTSRLARAVRAMGLPMAVFINKIDRLGARDSALLADIRRRLGVRIVSMNGVLRVGERTAGVAPHHLDDRCWRDSIVDLLAETSDAVIEEFTRTEGRLSARFIQRELRSQIAMGQIVPLFYGSAITGAGVSELLSGIADWLPPAPEMADGPVSALVFRIARQPSGEKLAFARIFTGSLVVRDRVLIRRKSASDEAVELEERITGVDRFQAGATTRAESASSGEIVVLHGLRSVRFGDWIGEEHATARQADGMFPAPKLESVVRPVDPGDVSRLRAALEQLAEQDPLISLRQRNDEGEISVRLFGEVQKEVVTETLAREYAIAATFGPSQTICVERPAAVGSHVESISDGENPFYATLGFRIEPAAPGAGIRYHRQLGSLPPAFYRITEATVFETLSQGLFGWEVTDCDVTLDPAGFSAPLSTGGDFRKLAPLVLMRALANAGTDVCEPIEELTLEIPEETFSAVFGLLIDARATIETSTVDGASHRMICHVPTAELRIVEQRLPGLTRGDGNWTSVFAGYAPVTGKPPARVRVGPDPLNRAHYLAEVARG